ncbi:MAG TPA: hypothetical protein VFV58_20680 [Blastocatellia bacterium]|nr:hypothetical protein [Blastocatellia bacterium]
MPSELWHGHKMIAAKESCLPFNAALLTPFARRAKRGLELPMRAEGDEAIGLLAPVPACARLFETAHPDIRKLSILVFRVLHSSL